MIVLSLVFFFSVFGVTFPKFKLADRNDLLQTFERKKITIDGSWCEIFGLSEWRPHHKKNNIFLISLSMKCLDVHFWLAPRICLAANVVISRLLAFCVGIRLYLSNAAELILLIYERRNGRCCLSNRMRDNTADIYGTISLHRFNAFFIRQMWNTTKLDQISRGFVALLLCRFPLVGHQPRYQNAENWIINKNYWKIVFRENVTGEIGTSDEKKRTNEQMEFNFILSDDYWLQKYSLPFASNDPITTGTVRRMESARDRRILWMVADDREKRKTHSIPNPIRTRCVCV